MVVYVPKNGSSKRVKLTKTCMSSKYILIDSLLIKNDQQGEIVIIAGKLSAD